MGRKALEKEITPEDIFRFTDNGLDIFERELPNVTLTKNIRSPFHIDTNPSFRVKKSGKSGLYIGTDYTTGKIYTGISLVQELYNLDFVDAMNKISWDFKISNQKTEYVKVNKVFEEKVIKPSEPILYEFTEMRFEKRHHNYWNSGELYEDFLKKNDIFAASHIAINKKVVEILDDEMCFIYVAKVRPYGELKILRIGHTVDKSQKWRTNIPNTYVWGLSDYKDYSLENLWVIKSRKDEMIAKLLDLSTTSVQSENDIILDMNMPKLKSKAKNIILSFGSDADGVKKSKIVQQKHDCKYYNTPKNMLPDINDLFSYVAVHGLRKLERHIKSKKL